MSVIRAKTINCKYSNLCNLLDVLVKFTKVILSSTEGEFFFMLNMFSSLFFNLECSFEKQRKDTLWPPS